ncbi:glycosyltransferase family 2 protein [Leucobacter ruminantium]|uniref:Glycosyltransferase family 2 protein n=1 Tax=Leucobacter ruminantium TaxID=1289170 RepID=A0A939LYM3_9MICO|nr:glycosyltransferase family 2 protein [Leucobacter ruminantium]MBO1805348.1 glycosyltransferase family 2 protein [Leucobacter ruminantium]
MRTRVTAVLVAQRGGDWLDETIAGIAAQTHAPDTIVAVNNGGGSRVGDQLIGSGAAHVVGLPSRLPFGQAVQHALHVDAVAGRDPEQEWIWLLTEDSCPEPEALDHIISSVQRAPSVVVAGPKLVDWDRPDRIIELGQSLTRYGSRWLLRRQELDQQQYDHMQDVLGVGPVGMLVRRDIWEQLGGFDPAFPVYDDGLDFCVRARLAGYRVEVSPASRIRFARSGVAGPHIDRRRSLMRVAHRQARTAQLHRRIAYAPAVVAFFEWLGLPLYGLLRMLWSLIREQPGQMLGELAAAFAVFFRPDRILASRRRIKAHSSAGWAAIRPLRMDPKSVRTARMIDREAILASTGRQRRELHFVSSGGLAVLSFAVVAAAACTWWALAETSLTGGGIAPLSPLGELWRNTRPLDGVPADPFTWVLALLGSLTFWNPSHALVLLLVVAIPLTALGGWIWAAQITESKAGRALVGVGFALSPMLLDSLSGGRLPTLILTIVLPWLLLAATRCRESWSWAGTASLLAAVALACAPVLIPAALVLLVAGLFTTLRGAAKVLTTALATAVLFAPKIVTALLQGRPLDIILDPGLTSAYEPGSIRHMLLGFPEFGLEGWGGIFDGIGLGAPPATLLVGALMLLIALLALVGLFTGRVAVTLFSSLLGGLGMLTALVSSQLHIGLQGNEAVAIWTGSGLAVYWLAVLTLGAVGAEALGRASTPVVGVALLTAMIAVAPMIVQLALAQTPFEPGRSQMPALVQAAGETDPGVRTLIVTAEGSHSVRVRSVVGTGARLDQVRTADEPPVVTADDRDLAELVGGLASTGGRDMSEQLRSERIAFVLLSPDGDETERAELQRVFDQHASLSSAGVTQRGLLWRVADAQPGSVEHGDAETRLRGTSITGHTIWTVQLVVLLGLVLLALPTGEVVERPARRKRPSRRRRAKAAAGAGPAAVAGEGSPSAAVVDAPEPETSDTPEAPGTSEDPGVPDDPGSPDSPPASTGPESDEEVGR